MEKTNLTGTEKQIAWAEQLRTAAIEAAEASIVDDETRELYAPTIDAFRRVGRADTWIRFGRRPVDAIYNWRNMLVAEGLPEPE